MVMGDFYYACEFDIPRILTPAGYATKGNLYIYPLSSFANRTGSVAFQVDEKIDGLVADLGDLAAAEL